MKTNTMKKFLLLASLCLVLGYPATDVRAQDVSHLPPEKAAVVMQWRNQFGPLPNSGTCQTVGMTRGEMRRYLERELLNKLDPILVGKNVIFSKEWLDRVVGSNKLMSRQQFEAYRDQTDKIYDCYEYFAGRNPGKVFIGLVPKDKFPGNYRGHWHHASKMICLNRDHFHIESDLRGIAVAGGGRDSSTMMHELAHAFSYRAKGWGIDGESMAEFFIAYAMEHMNIRIGFATRGRAHRDSRYIQTINPTAPFSGSSHSPSAFRYYLFGLVDKVGWETFRKTSSSYDNNTYQPTKTYDGARQVAQAHEFFDRLAHFHDVAREQANTDSGIGQSIPPVGRNLTGMQALRSLPDKGALLDKYLTVATTPIENNSMQVQPPEATPPIIQAATVQTPTPEQSVPTPSRRVWVNPDYGALNQQ